MPDANEEPRANQYNPSSIQVYEYWARIIRVIDGDTVDAAVSLGFDTSVSARFRLLGIDTPEIYSVRHDSDEYKAGRAAADYLEQRLPVDSWVELKVYTTGKREKYGRWLAQIIVNGESINEEMVHSGHASRTT